MRAYFVTKLSQCQAKEKFILLICPTQPVHFIQNKNNVVNIQFQKAKTSFTVSQAKNSANVKAELLENEKQIKIEM